MNLSTIARQVRVRKTQVAVEGLENAHEGTEFSHGVLVGQVRALEEVAQMLDKLAHDEKYEDPQA